ncbi:MAG: hypothetical protein ACXWBQ_14630, partial [Usitatibacter sp.]
IDRRFLIPSEARRPKSSGLRAFATANKNMGTTAMRALRLKWKWRARLARYEQEARHAMRAWLMV